MADIEDIKKANDERKLNILKGFSEVEEIQKANFNFAKNNDDTSDEEADDNDNSGDDVPGTGAEENVTTAEDQMQNDEASDNLSQDQDDSGDGFKTISDFAKETSSEDLQLYLDENPDGEHAEEARQELEERGDLNSKETQTIDYSNPEAVKQALENHPDKETIIQMMLEDPTLTASMALRLHDSKGGDKVGLSEKIDAAQSALDDLKSHVGHEDEDNWFDDDYDDGMQDQDDNDDEESEEYEDEDDDLNYEKDSDFDDEDDDNDSFSDEEEKKKKFNKQ